MSIIDIIRAWLIDRHAKAVRAYVRHSGAQSTKGSAK